MGFSALAFIDNTVVLSLACHGLCSGRKPNVMLPALNLAISIINLIKYKYSGNKSESAGYVRPISASARCHLYTATPKAANPCTADFQLCHSSSFVAAGANNSDFANATTNGTVVDRRSC